MMRFGIRDLFYWTLLVAVSFFWARGLPRLERECQALHLVVSRRAGAHRERWGKLSRVCVQ